MGYFPGLILRIEVQYLILRKVRKIWIILSGNGGPGGPGGPDNLTIAGAHVSSHSHG